MLGQVLVDPAGPRDINARYSWFIKKLAFFVKLLDGIATVVMVDIDGMSLSTGIWINSGI